MAWRLHWKTLVGIWKVPAAPVNTKPLRHAITNRDAEILSVTIENKTSTTPDGMTSP